MNTAILLEAENADNQKNIIKSNLIIEEDLTYPLDNHILYRERVNNITKRSFNYVIIKEGIYLDGINTRTKNKQNLASLQDSIANINDDNDENNKIKKRPAQQYKIPHDYTVETTWGRASKKRTVCCEINYINTVPQFQIKYGSNFQHIISSTTSTSNAALIYEKVNIYYIL